MLAYERKGGTGKVMASPGILAAETLSDALVAAFDEPAYIAVAERMLRRYADAPEGVSVTLKEAADELGVSLPTVRNWIALGVLVQVSSKPQAVSIPSLAAVLAAKESGGLGDDPRPTAKLLDEFRDRHLLTWARSVAGTASEGDFITYSEEDLAELEQL